MLSDEKRGIKINLQLFGEDAPPEGQAPSPIDQPSIDQQLGNLYDSAANPSEPTAPTENPQPQPNQPAPQPVPQEPAKPVQDELILGKFKNIDEVTKGYRNLESSYTKAAMEKAEIARQLEEIKRQNEEFSKVQNPQTIQQPAEPVDPEEFLSKFYENPQEAISKVVETTTKKVTEELEQKYAPIKQMYDEQAIEKTWNKQIGDLMAQKPDFMQYKAEIGQYIKSKNLDKLNDPAQVSDALQTAYYMAKGMRAEQQPSQPQPSIDEILSREDVINSILARPDIVNRAVQAHMQNIQGKQVPNVINNTGGTSPATPPERPKTLEEAHRQLQARLMNNMA